MVSHAREETQHFFQKLAERLKSGQVVGFRGELGAGKTTAIQAILASYGIGGGESPTFVMVRPYALRQPVRGISSIVHVDAYRLDNHRDAQTTGLTDVLADRRALVLVEWADRIQSFLPKETVWVDLRHAGEDNREVEVTWP